MDCLTWYRNKEWNPRVEAKFFARLERAEDPAFCLSVQAACLARSHPKVAMDLLGRFFGLPDDSHVTSALWSQATALKALGDIEGAKAAYERTLQQESSGRVRVAGTTTDWALLIAEAQLVSDYQRALGLLKRESPFSALEVFKRNGALALIHWELGDVHSAQEHARLAMRAAGTAGAKLHSHDSAGIVEPEWYEVRRRLLEILAQTNKTTRARIGWFQKRT